MQWPPPRPRPSSEPSSVEDLDARLAQQRVGVFVALVADDDAGLEGDDVVAVVPLLALGLPLVAAGADDAQLLEARARPATAPRNESSGARPARPPCRPGAASRP